MTGTRIDPAASDEEAPDAAPAGAPVDRHATGVGRRLDTDLRTVADFVVGVALGRDLGAARPIGAPASDRSHLRLVR